MTQRQHRTVIGLLCIVGSVLLALALLQLHQLGEAHADTPDPIAASVGSGSDGNDTRTDTQPRDFDMVVPAQPAATPPAAGTGAEVDSSDVARLWRTGSIIGAVSVAVFLLLTFLARVDAKRAFYWSSGVAAFGVVIDVVASGSTPTLGMILTAVTTLIALVARGPLAPPTSREPQRGAAGLDVMLGTVLAMGAVALMLVAVASSAGCGTAKRAGTAIASDVVDCTIGVAKQSSDQYGALLEAVIRDATRPDGSVDWPPIKAAAHGFAIDDGACVLATVVARILAAPSAKPGTTSSAIASSPPGPDHATLIVGFNEIRAELFHGARFKTASGSI